MVKGKGGEGEEKEGRRRGGGVKILKSCRVSGRTLSCCDRLEMDFYQEEADKANMEESSQIPVIVDSV